MNSSFDSSKERSDCVHLIQECFKLLGIPLLTFCQVLIAIPKGDNGDFRGIGLVDTLWKVISSIINNRLQHAYPFHGFLHSFRPLIGMETTITEVKLLLDEGLVTERPIFEVFINFQKAFDTVRR